MSMGLFRPLNRRLGSQSRSHNVESTTTFDGRLIEVVSAFTLAADDLMILLAATALAGFQGERADEQMASEKASEPLIRITTTWYALLREAGMSDGKHAYDNVKRSLKRLRGVYYTDCGRVGGNSDEATSELRQSLLGYSVVRGTGELSLTLNSRFTHVLLGAQFSRIDMTHMRALSGETARILYARLSTWVRQGHSRIIGIAKLLEWVHGPVNHTKSAEMRRSRIRAALRQIDERTTWDVALDKDPVRITRPHTSPGGVRDRCNAA